MRGPRITRHGARACATHVWRQSHVTSPTMADHGRGSRRWRRRRRFGADSVSRQLHSRRFVCDGDLPASRLSYRLHAIRATCCRRPSPTPLSDRRRRLGAAAAAAARICWRRWTDSVGWHDITRRLCAWVITTTLVVQVEQSVGCVCVCARTKTFEQKRHAGSSWHCPGQVVTNQSSRLHEENKRWSSAAAGTADRG